MTVLPFFLSIEFTRFFALVSLEIFVLLVLFQLLYSVHGDKKDLQKIIGGLLVFIIAIIAHNPLIYFFSLFIGGLIIASEEFMKFIFAVWKSDPQIIDRTIQSFQSISVATPEEIQEKAQQEVESIAAAKPASESTRQRFRQKYHKVERLVHEYFRSRYGERYVEQVKLENLHGQMVFDGAVLVDQEMAGTFIEEESQNRTDIQVLYGVEIKYFLKTADVEPEVQRLLEKLSFYSFDFIQRIVIVVEKISDEEAESLYLQLLNTYRNHSQFYFQIARSNQGTVTFINPSRI